MMNVRFIDTSVMVNLLEVPGMCSDAEKIKEEWIEVLKVGDMSIVYAYKQYKEKTPAIGSIMIWSTDKHLQSYHEENVSTITRRRRRN